MVYVFLANGFEEIEALYPLDILRRAGISVKTVGVGEKTITGAHKIPIICDITTKELDNNENFDMIILPGGLPGATNLDADKTVDEFIKLAVLKDKFIGAICAAPFILGKRGILKGKRATCYPGFEKQLDNAVFENSGIVRDGKIITCRAMGSAADFALELLSVLTDESAKEKMKRAILY